MIEKLQSLTTLRAISIYKMCIYVCLFGDEISKWLMSLTEDLMIVILRPTMAQDISNLSNSER